MIISTAIQNIPVQVWTDYFVAVNLHPHHHLSFSGWIKKIAPAVRTGETAYFQNHKGSYHYAMPSVWKKMTIIKIIEVMYFIDIFIAENPRGKYPWIKQNVLSLILFVPLGQIPKIKYAIWLRVNILR